MTSSETDPQVRRISVRSKPSTIQSSHELSEVSNRQYREQMRLYEDDISSDDSGVIRHISVKSNPNDYLPFDSQRFFSRSSTQESQEDTNSIQDSFQNSVQSSRYSKHDYSRMLNITKSSKKTAQHPQQQYFNNTETTPSPSRQLKKQGTEKYSAQAVAPTVPVHSSNYNSSSPPSEKKTSPNRHSMIEVPSPGFNVGFGEVPSPGFNVGFGNSPSLGSINANRLSYLSTYSGVVQDVNIDTVKYVVDNNKSLDLPPDVLSEVTEVPRSTGKVNQSMPQSSSLQSLNRLLRSSSTGGNLGPSGSLGSTFNPPNSEVIRTPSNTSFSFVQPPNISGPAVTNQPKLSDVEDNEEESFSSHRHVLPTTKTSSNEHSGNTELVAATATGVGSARYITAKSKQPMKPDKEQTTNLEIPVPPRSPKRPLSGNFSSTSIEESLHKFEEDQLKTPKQRQQEKLMKRKERPELVSVMANIVSNTNDQGSIDESHTPQISLLETPLKRKSISSDSAQQPAAPSHLVAIGSPASSVPLSNPLNENSEQGSCSNGKRSSSQESLPTPASTSVSERFIAQERRVSGATGFSETPERRMSGLINDKFDDIMKEFEHLKSEIEEQALTEKKSNEDEIISDEERLLSKIHDESNNHRRPTAGSIPISTGAFGATPVSSVINKVRKSSTTSNAINQSRSLSAISKNISTGPVSTSPIPIAADNNYSTSRVASIGVETITSSTSITPELLSTRNTINRKGSNNDLSLAQVLPSASPIPGMMSLSPTHRRALSSDMIRDSINSPSADAYTHRRNHSALSGISGLSSGNDHDTAMSGYYTATSQNNSKSNSNIPLTHSHKRTNSNTSFTDRSYSLSNSIRTAESFVTAKEDEYYDPAASFFKSHSRNNSSNNNVNFGTHKPNPNSGLGPNLSNKNKTIRSIIKTQASGALTATTSGESEKFPYDPSVPLMKQDSGSSSASDVSIFEGDKDKRRLSKHIKLVDSSNEEEEEEDELYEDIETPADGKSSKATKSRSKKYGKVRRSGSGKTKKKAIKPFSYDTLARLLNATDGIVIGQEFADLQIPNEEKYLIEKIVDSISRLTANMMLNPSRYQQGCNRLEKVLNALEGFE